MQIDFQTIAIIAGVIQFLILVGGFILSRISAIRSQAKNESEIDGRIKSVCEAHKSDVEKLELKLTYQSDKLHTHITQNETEHRDIKSYMDSIDEKFNRIMSSIAALEERTKK